MTDKFRRPSDIIDMQDTFSEREVGLTHPDISSHIRLKDNGDIEIITGEGLGIIFNRKNRSITFVGDTIKFLTKDGANLRWNKLAFNHKATTYSEPTFSSLPNHDLTSIYKGVSEFFEED